MNRNSKQRSALQKYGVRSGLEKANHEHLRRLGARFLYEQVTLPYTMPETLHRYTPDYVFPNGIVVETKGRWQTADRKKIKLFVQQHPEIDFRIVFSNPNARISKQSKTTYAKFCETHGIPYAAKLIPVQWISEPRNEASLAALKSLNMKRRKTA